MPRVVVLPVEVTAAIGEADRAADITAWLAAVEPRRILARSRTTETAAVDLPGYGPAIRKRWWWPRPRDLFRGAFRTTFAAPSPARREHDALLRLRSLRDGPFAPSPIGLLEERRAGVLLACMLLVEEIPGAVDLASWLHGARDPGARSAVLADLARRTRGMHDAGIVDREMHPRNVLVDAQARRTWKIDVPKQRQRSTRARRADVVDDLACLDVGIARLASRPERSAFLAAYLGPASNANELTALDADVTARRAVQDVREARRLPQLPVDADR